MEEDKKVCNLIGTIREKISAISDSSGNFELIASLCKNSNMSVTFNELKEVLVE